MLLWY